MADVRRQIELWSSDPVEVAPLRLEGAELVVDGTRLPRVGAEVDVYARDRNVGIFLLVATSVLVGVCGGGGFLGGGTTGALCALPPLVIGGGLTLASWLLPSRVRVTPAEGEEIRVGIPDGTDASELELLAERLKREALPPLARTQRAIVVFVEREPRDLCSVFREVRPIDLATEALPLPDDEGVRERLGRATLAFHATFDPVELIRVVSWCAGANGILLQGDDEVVDPDVERLDAFFGQLETPRPADSIARRKASRLALLGLGERTPPVHLPSIAVDELVAREPREVAERAHALFLVSMAAQEFLHTGQVAQLAEPLAQAALSPAERAWAESPDPQQAQQLSFRLEGLRVLAWALGWLDEVPPISECWDPEAEGDHEALQRAQRREPGETVRDLAVLADRLDLVYCAHWVVRNARMTGGDLSDALDPSAVLEQHIALLWLTEAVDWDAVQPHT